MKEVLSHPKRILEVLKIHKGISDLYLGLSLEDILVVGFNWDRIKIDSVMKNNFYYKNLDRKVDYEELKNFFYEWNYDSEHPSLNKFRCYNQSAIQHARHRAVFLQDMKSKGHDLSNSFDELSELPQLEELSCYSILHSTVTYAIKCYLISNYSELGIANYRGIQPQTGPVHNSVLHLYGKSFSNYQHTTLCNNLSDETGLSSTYINTAFYTMG